MIHWNIIGLCLGGINRYIVDDQLKAMTSRATFVIYENIEILIVTEKKSDLFVFYGIIESVHFNQKTCFIHFAMNRKGSLNENGINFYQISIQIP